MKNKTLTISKIDAMKRFFGSYAGDINGDLYTMTDDELEDYLSSDIFIGVAAAALNIPEHDFVEYAPIYFAEKRNER